MQNLKHKIYKTIGKSLPCREATVHENYQDLPIFDLLSPHGEILVQHIAPYDDDIKKKLIAFFPIRPKAESFVVGERPRSLSFHPGCADNKSWNSTEGEVAYAMSISLYEDDTRQGLTVGDPIADCAAVMCSQNCVLMVCADGCGWGEAASTAARIAVLSTLRSLTENIFNTDDITKSSDVFSFLSEALESAQGDLIASGGTGLTTLCATVIAPLNHGSAAEKQWVVCNVRVGDTATYKYCKRSKQLNIISHNLSSKERDMQICGGCLGPVVGNKPDLANLQYSVSIVDSHCTVFLATDGVGDNFNPYVTNQLSESRVKCSDFELDSLVHKVYCSCCNEHAECTSCDLNDMPKHKDLEISLSDMTTHNLHCTCKMENVESLCPTLVAILSLKYFQQTIKSYYQDSSITVKEFVISVCRMLVQSTDLKRTVMGRYQERVKGLSSEETKQVHRYHRRYVKTLPGKLDHASLVAVNLVRMVGLDNDQYSQSTGSPRPDARLGIRLGSGSSPFMVRSRQILQGFMPSSLSPVTVSVSVSDESFDDVNLN